MIKINLLGDEGAADNSGRLQVGAFAASIILVAGLFFVTNYLISSGNTEMSERVSSLERQLAEVQKVTREVKDLEKKRDEYNKKLLVIATLKKSRVGPVRVMDDLNHALPEKSWLNEAKETTGVMRLVGLALDDPTISNFMRDLEKSDYFDAVELVETKKVDRDGVKVREFLIQTKIIYTGKVEISNEDGAVKDPKAAEKDPKQASRASSVYHG